MADLAGARAKLDRAEQHLYALDRGMRAWAERKPYRLVERFDPRPGETVGDIRFAVAGVAPPPPVLGVHLGEVVHDLHSALDHLAWAVAERPWRRTQFPVFLKAETWAETSEPITRSIPERYVRIMEEAQPYREKRPAAHLLALLNHLWNADRHRLVEMRAAALADGAPSLRPGRDVAALVDVRFHIGLLQEGTELVRAVVEPAGPEPTVALEGDVAVGVAFDDTSARGRPLHGEQVVPLLWELRRHAEEIYAAFAAA